MPRTITISLPVTDLTAAKVFYTAIGFTFDPQCSGDNGALMVASETISVMLLPYDTWRTFTTRPICPSTASEVALNISCDSREEVDAMNKAAGAHGGTSDINPIEDFPFMYGRDFTDPDGHVWGARWMDFSMIPAGEGGAPRS